MSGAWWIWIALASGLFGALLSVLQHTLKSVSRGSLEHHIASRARRAGVADEGLPPGVSAIADDLDGHAAAVAVPRLLCNLLAGIALVLWIAFLRERAPGWPSVLIGITAAGVMVWLLSVVIPLAVAAHAAERTVVGWALPIRAMWVALGPLRLVVGFTREVVRRLAGEDAVDESVAREAELLSLVEESEREGQLDQGARDMIEAVVEFRTTTVEQIMTPRTEVQALEYTDDLDAVKQYVCSVGHSRIPVYDDDLDHLVGVLYAKDLLRWIVADGAGKPAARSAGGGFVLRTILRDPTFVPETKTVSELLAELLEQKVHIAIALDEYGGTSGLVTIEDIVEEIFGEIQDEYEPEEDRDTGVTINTETGSAEVDGRTEIDDANDELEDIGLEIPEHDDYDTVGGFVVTTMGKIPAAGDSFRHNGITVTVLESEPTRVVRIRVERAEAAETADS